MLPNKDNWIKLSPLELEWDVNLPMKERFQSRIYLDAPAGTGKTKNPVEEIYRISQEILKQNARDVKNITYIEMNQPLPSAEEWKKFQAFMDEHSKTEITPDDAYKPKDNN